MRNLVYVFVGLALAACGGDNNTTPDAARDFDAPAAPDAGPQPSAARGQYLVEHVLACGDCHTPRLQDGSPDLANWLAGVDCFVDLNGGGNPGGCISSRNLTNDATGLANRSDAEIKNMFQNGMRPNGEALIPLMPYYQFHNLTDVDADSLVLYLRTVPAVVHTVQANDVPPPTTATAPFDPNLMADPTPSNPQTLAGKYIATVSCMECHTMRTNPTDFGSIDTTKLLAGGNGFPSALLGLPVPPFPDTIYSMNLTPDATGLATYSADDIVNVLANGVDMQGMGVCPPMPAGPMGAFGGMTADDKAAVAAYIKAIPAIANQLPNGCSIGP